MQEIHVEMLIKTIKVFCLSLSGPRSTILSSEELQLVCYFKPLSFVMAINLVDT